MKTKIISAFPACGKTYAFEKLNQKGYTILDSDSSKFSWTEREYTEDELQKIKEEWESKPYMLRIGEGYIDLIRHNKIKVRNPEFPNNYIQHIKENIGKVDYIFVSSHKEVRDALNSNNIFFTLIYPDRSMKAEWIGRCFLRGSGEKFCQMLADNWDKWIDEMKSTEHCDRWVLGRDEIIDNDEKTYCYLSELIEDGQI